MDSVSRPQCALANAGKRLLLGILLVCFAALVVTPLMAGTGEEQGGVFDFGMSLRFHATDAQIAELAQQFQEASDILLDITDGQHRFGEVFVCNDCLAGRAAEFYVLPNSGTSNAPGDYGTAGEHINAFYDKIVGTYNGRDLALTIVHEWGHHTLSLSDEYSGPASCDNGTPRECVTDVTATACIMDNYKERGPAGGPSELCVSSNHDPDQDTWQECSHHKDCWTHAASKWTSLTAPAGTPTDAAPASQAITWTVLEPEKRFVSVIDRSGSMSGQRMTLAKTAASLFVSLAETGDKIGVVSFATSPSVNFALTEVTSDAIKDAARAAISGLTASGMTAMGAGLQTGLGQFTSQSKRACQQVVILLSDGYHNTGIHPSSVIPGLKNNGVIVHSIGVGTSVDNILLSSIASQTGGVFRHVTSAFSLPTVYLSLWSETSDDAGILNLEPGEIAAGDPPQLIAGSFESGEDRAIFALTWEGNGNDLDLALIDPDGVRIDAGTAPSFPEVEMIQVSNAEVFIVDLPKPGVWQMEISHVSGASPIIYTAQIIGEGGEAEFLLQTDGDLYAYPEQVLVQGHVMHGNYVAGATVEGDVLRPGGSRVGIALYDDGNPAHGDQYQNDGVYSNYFSEYSDDGVYTFEITAVNESGTYVEGEILTEDDIPNQTPIPPFSRFAAVSVIVEGVPDFIVADLDFDPNTLNRKSKGRYVTAYLQMPAGYDVADIEVSSVLLQDALPAETKGFKIGDHNEDGIPDLSLKFDRQELIDLLATGLNVPITLRGMVDGMFFHATDEIHVIEPGFGVGVTASMRDDGQPGQVVNLSWNPQEYELPVVASVFKSNSKGRSWELLASDIPAVGSWSGDLQLVEPDTVRFAIVEHNAERVEGVGVSSDVGVGPGEGAGKFSPDDEGSPTIGISPNPFNATTTFEFSIGTPMNVQIHLYDLLGRRVKTLVNRTFNPGRHAIIWDGTDNQGNGVASGVYFARISLGDETVAKKLLLLK